MLEGVLLFDKPEGPTTAACSRKLGKVLTMSLRGSDGVRSNPEQNGSMDLPTTRLLRFARNYKTCHSRESKNSKKGKRELKVGHAGTLDPMATGLVVELIGRATKLSPYISDEDKVYTGRIYLGCSTDTGDKQGDIVAESPVEVDESKLFEIAELVMGKQMQLPPAFSAVKHKGKPLYKYARDGRAVNAKPREVNVASFEITSVNLPEVAFETRVSKGTYIRVLAERFGELAGCGAHLTELRRTAVGRFGIEDALSFEEAIRLAEEGNIEEKLISLKESLSHLKCLEIQKEQTLQIAYGKIIEIDEVNLMDGELFTISMNGKLLAVARWCGETGKPYFYERVLINPEEFED